MIRKLAEEDPDETNDKEKRGLIHIPKFEIVLLTKKYLISFLGMTLQMLKSPVMKMRRKVNMPNSGMNLESRLSLVL